MWPAAMTTDLQPPFYVSEFSARSSEVNKAACEKDVVGIRLFSGSQGLETRDPCGSGHLIYYYMLSGFLNVCFSTVAGTQNEN